MATADPSPSQAHYDELQQLLARMRRLPLPGKRTAAFPDLSQAEIFLLGNIGRIAAEGKDATISSLAERIGVSSAAVTNTVTALVRLDYARRERSSQDRRVVLVTLTDKGKSGLERLLGEREEWFKGLLDFLGEADTRDLVRLGGRLAEYLEMLAHEAHTGERKLG